MIRVLVADDQDLVRAGLRMILEGTEDLEVVAEAATGAEALREAVRTRPDVVLMDIRMPDVDGIEATRQLMAHPAPPRVLILTTYDTDDHLRAALQAGASGFLLKTAPPNRLVEGIRLVANGEALLAPTLIRRLIEEYVERQPASASKSRIDGLTPRETEVLSLVARGQSNAEIATTMVVSEATVKTHVNRLFQKLGVRDRVQAVILAYESGLVSR